MSVLGEVQKGLEHTAKYSCDQRSAAEGDEVARSHDQTEESMERHCSDEARSSAKELCECRRDRRDDCGFRESSEIEREQRNSRPAQYFLLIRIRLAQADQVSSESILHRKAVFAGTGRSECSPVVEDCG